MDIYILQCLNEDGKIEINGYFRYAINAEKARIRRDNYPENLKYEIKHEIIHTETED